MGAAQRIGHEGDPLGVVRGGDPVLRHHDRPPAHRRRPPHRVLDGLGPALVAHLGDRDGGIVGSQPVGTEVHAGVALHPHEVVALRGTQEDVLEHLLGRVAQCLPTLGRGDLRHGEREADREVPRTGAQDVDGEPVGAHHRLVHRRVAREVVLDPRRVLALEVPHDGDHVRLVDGAGPSDEVAQVGRRPLDEAGETLGGVGRLPSTAGGEPQRGREVMEGDDGDDPVAVAGRAQPPVVLQRGNGELAFGGLNPAPLQREAVRPESHVGHELEVLAPAVKESHASPLGSSVPDAGLCSHAHQSLFTLPPSI